MEMKKLWSFRECVKFMASLYSRNTSNSSVHFPFLIETLPAIGFYVILPTFFFYLTDCSLPSLPCWHYYFWFTSQWKVLSLSLFCYPTILPAQEKKKSTSIVLNTMYNLRFLILHLQLGLLSWDTLLYSCTYLILSLECLISNSSLKYLKQDFWFHLLIPFSSLPNFT